MIAATATTTTTTRGTEVHCITSVDELYPFRDQIDAFSSVPFLRSAWMIPWIETWVSAGDLRFLLVKSGGNVVGFAPLVYQESLSRGRHYCFVGSGKACADYMSFPAADGHIETTIKSVATWLQQDAKNWDRIELDGVAASDQTLRRFVELCADGPNQLQVIPGLPSYRMELPNDWETVLSTLSKNSRKKYRRLERALEGTVELHHATDETSLSVGLACLERLHTARWNSIGEQGCFGHDGFGAFLRATAKAHFAEGSLRLIWMTQDDQPISADIAFQTDAGVFTYQGGISPNHLDLEPGRAILKSQIELSMKNGAAFMDFLRGDEPYKSRFKTKRIENVRYEISGPRLRGLTTQKVLDVGRTVKSLLPSTIFSK